MLLCMLCFVYMWCMRVAISHKIRVFDPGRLLGVRVGNLNESSIR